MSRSKLTLSYLPGADVIFLKQYGDVFITTGDSIVIGRNTILAILSYLIKNKAISSKTLEGLLEEVNTE